MTGILISWQAPTTSTGRFIQLNAAIPFPSLPFHSLSFHSIPSHSIPSHSLNSLLCMVVMTYALRISSSESRRSLCERNGRHGLEAPLHYCYGARTTPMCAIRFQIAPFDFKSPHPSSSIVSHSIPLSPDFLQLWSALFFFLTLKRRRRCSCGQGPWHSLEALHGRTLTAIPFLFNLIHFKPSPFDSKRHHSIPKRIIRFQMTPFDSKWHH